MWYMGTRLVLLRLLLLFVLLLLLPAFLEAIHRKGILHCDMKPGNILCLGFGEETVGPRSSCKQW